jgi:hypothetical protein
MTLPSDFGGLGAPVLRSKSKRGVGLSRRAPDGKSTLSPATRFDFKSSYVSNNIAYQDKMSHQIPHIIAQVAK